MIKTVQSGKAFLTGDPKEAKEGATGYLEKHILSRGGGGSSLHPEIGVCRMCGMNRSGYVAGSGDVKKPGGSYLQRGSWGQIRQSTGMCNVKGHHSDMISECPIQNFAANSIILQTFEPEIFMAKITHSYLEDYSLIKKFYLIISLMFMVFKIPNS